MLQSHGLCADDEDVPAGWKGAHARVANTPLISHTNNQRCVHMSRNYRGLFRIRSWQTKTKSVCLLAKRFYYYMTRNE